MDLCTGYDSSGPDSAAVVRLWMKINESVVYRIWQLLWTCTDYYERLSQQDCIDPKINRQIKPWLPMDKLENATPKNHVLGEMGHF